MDWLCLWEDSVISAKLYSRKCRKGHQATQQVRVDLNQGYQSLTLEPLLSPKVDSQKRVLRKEAIPVEVIPGTIIPKEATLEEVVSELGEMVSTDTNTFT